MRDSTFRTLLICCAMPMALLSQPALANDTDDGDEVDSTLIRLLAALKLSDATGETTLGENPGELEGVMMTAWAMDSAADMIAKRVGTNRTNYKFIVTYGNTSPSLGDFTLFKTATEILVDASNQVQHAHCRADGVAPDDAVGINAIDPVSAVTAILDLLKTDTKITGFSVEGMDAALAANIAGRLSKSYVVDGPVTIADSNEAFEAFKDVQAVQQEMRKTLQDSSVCNGFNDADKAALQARIAENDTFLAKSLARPEGGGRSPLERAAAVAGLDSQTGVPLVLNIKIVHAGGSIIERKNLFTVLGAPAVGLTGGLVGHYTLRDPASGKIEEGGTIVCRTDKTSFGKVQNGPTPGNCTVSEKAS